MRFTMTLVLLLSTAVMYAQDAEKTMLASDGKTQITVPGHWTELELNDVAEIELGNADDPAYLIVINELKEDLFGWNIEKHSRVTLGGLLGTLAFPTVEGPRAIKVGGSPAIQYEVSGALEGQKIVRKGEPIFAYYDPPWTPTFMRRNEVMVTIDREND